MARLIDGTGAFEAILRAGARWGTRRLPVLSYHSVRELEPLEPFDPGVIDATPVQLDRQVATLKRYFTLIGVEELCAHLDGRELPRNAAIITFDDGYRDNFEVALPILLRHRVKATFFVATSYLTLRRVFWWDRIAYAIARSPHHRIALEYPFPVELDLATRRDRARERLLRLVKDTEGLDLERFLDGLGAATSVAWSAALERRLADRLVMTWDQVRALRRAGMEVQSHTRTHRVLQTLGCEQLAEELLGSRIDLEKELGEEVRAVSYPVGRTVARSARIRAALAQAGYALGFSNATGVNRLGADRLDPYDLHRVSIGRDVSLPLFRGILAVPRLAPRG